MKKTNKINKTIDHHVESIGEINSDTEMAHLPMKHLKALVENKDGVIEQYDNDRIRLAGECKGLKEEITLFTKAYEKEKNHSRELKTKCETLERELGEFKNPKKSSAKVSEILNKIKKNTIIFDDDTREAMVDDYYKKHYESKIEKLRKELNV